MATATLPPTQLLTEREAADMLGVNSQTLSLWRCTKRYPLPYVKVGRSVRYRLADIEKWIESRTVEPGAAA